jgi:hypothetical protein
MRKLTRRTFISSTAAAGIAASIAAGRATAASPQLVQTRHAYGTDWSRVRGFNYQPSYGRNGLEIWYNFDAGRIAAELALGKLYFPKLNAIRIWLASDAFQGRETAFGRDLDRFISAVDTIGCKAMPVLFNRWAGLPDFGAIYMDHFIPGSLRKEQFDKLLVPYLAATVGEYRNDERILVWDLCNEPYINQSALGRKDDTPRVVEEAETGWLRRIYREAKALEPSQPVTIAAHGKFPLSRFNEFSDILSAHPYWFPGKMTEAEHEKALDAHVTYANAVSKPLLASECCWGEEDDAEHVKSIAYSLSQLSKRGIGFLPDALHHSLVADEHRPEHGPVGVEMMAFIEANGRLRAGHEVYNDY